MVVQKPTKESRVSKPDSWKQVLPDEMPIAVNNFDSNRLMEKNNLPSAFSRNEILLHANIPTKKPGLIRNMFIDKYIQTQRNSVFLEDNPVVEIKI
ncbi:MAG: hypothetical protein NT178_00220 [Proteobacteria bacterium]|nr:hypothetical protein [Pseudomonadota bacterium]